MKMLRFNNATVTTSNYHLIEMPVASIINKVRN